MHTKQVNDDLLIYYLDHDQRYAHIPKRHRWKYPDEVRLGFSLYKRTKPLREITLGEAGGRDPLLLANDVPITDSNVFVRD